MGNMLVEHVMEKALRDKMKAQMQEQQKHTKRPPPPQDDDEEDVDDEDLKQMLREMKLARMKEMQQQLKKQEGAIGEYREISQDEFLPTVTKSALSLVHFFHKDFERCKIMDKHLAQIAQLYFFTSTSHPETKFTSLNAEKAPFFVEKLAIQMLPTVCLFQDGVLRHKLVGFQELGAKDSFSTDLLLKV